MVHGPSDISDEDVPLSLDNCCAIGALAMQNLVFEL